VRYKGEWPTPDGSDMNPGFIWIARYWMSPQNEYAGDPRGEARNSLGED